MKPTNKRLKSSEASTSNNEKPAVKKADSDDQKVHEDDIFRDNASQVKDIIVLSSDSEESDDDQEDSDSEASDSSEKKQDLPADSDDYYNDDVDSDSYYDKLPIPKEPTVEECQGSSDEVDSDDNCGD